MSIVFYSRVRDDLHYEAAMAQKGYRREVREDGGHNYVADEVNETTLDVLCQTLHHYFTLQWILHTERGHRCITINGEEMSADPFDGTITIGGKILQAHTPRDIAVAIGCPHPEHYLSIPYSSCVFAWQQRHNTMAGNALYHYDASPRIDYYEGWQNGILRTQAWYDERVAK